ncbi:MAG: ATP-dependent Clp protease proteolytic subunit [Candidatus Melainabacteria bacterium]|nr:ATP-dependent Clp protease proteolytic subunit [Candidatus Melainabacteria bacterium]
MTNSNLSPSALRDRLVRAQVSVLESEARAVEEKVARIRAGGFFNRQVDVVGDIGSATSSSAYRIFTKWALEEPNQQQPYVLQLNSGGGNYINSFAMYDIIRLFQKDGRQVTAANMGMMGTQAAILMQSAKRRVMSPSSWIVLKEVEGTAKGNTNAHRDAVRFFRTLEEHGWKLLLERSSLEKQQILDNTYRGGEWWIGAEEALKFGLIDEICAEVQVLPCADIVDPDLLPLEGDSWSVRKHKAAIRKTLAESELLRMTRYDSLDTFEETNQVLLFSDVSPASCSGVTQSMNSFIRRNTPAVDFVINSPGGCVVSGAGTMDVLDKAKANGTKLSTTIYGYAASMGGFLSQTGAHRRMTRNAYFMIHQVSAIFGGSSSHLDEKQANMERLQQMLFTHMSERSGGKLSMETLKANCNDHDWWLTPEEALSFGLIDEII